MEGGNEPLLLEKLAHEIGDLLVYGANLLLVLGQIFAPVLLLGGFETCEFFFFF